MSNTSLTEKVLDVWDVGLHITCIKYKIPQDQYRIYCNWYDNGYHKKLIGKCDNITAVLEYVRDVYERFVNKK